MTLRLRTAMAQVKLYDAAQVFIRRCGNTLQWRVSTLSAGKTPTQILGDENGKVPKVMEKPVQGYLETPIVVSDDFASPEDITWEWNHNPDNTLWSLTERKGHMRLKTGRVTPSIFEARNMLSQRTEGRMCSGTIALDIRNMHECDIAGLAAYCSEPEIIQVMVKNGRKFIVMKDCDEEKERVEIKKQKVYLRLDCDFTNGVDKAEFYYSLNTACNSTLVATGKNS